MRFEVTLDELEEYALCIVDCSMDRDEASEYLKACVTGRDISDDSELIDAAIVNAKKLIVKPSKNFKVK